LTTSTSNGSVGAMHDSFNPMTGLMPMIGMWLNATFGGVGRRHDQHVRLHHHRRLHQPA
jgi:K+-transporting ATPase A subunit